MKEMLLKEDAIVECLGYEGAWDALVSALGTDKCNDMFDYIMRCYEIDINDINDNDF